MAPVMTLESQKEIHPPGDGLKSTFLEQKNMDAEMQ